MGLQETAAAADADDDGDSYLSNVRLRTETCVDAPRATTLAEELGVEVRVHLH